MHLTAWLVVLSAGLCVLGGLLEEFVGWEGKGKVSLERYGAPLKLIGLSGESCG